jgi:acetyl esterase/lipase
MSIHATHVVRAVTLTLATVFLTAACTFAQAPQDPIPLWPGAAPGDKGDIGEEKDTTKPGQDKGRHITRLGNVSKPTITVFRPPADKDTGAAVVVCPGGAYQILAMDLEGTEVCEWLNSLGVTGVLLKYRVPARKGLEKHAAALQDAQRAVGLVRQHAKEWKLDARRIGVLGFSAGGHLAASVSTNFASRTYPTVDDADKESCRPDFTVLVYPAYLIDKDDPSRLAADIKVSGDTPPAFAVMTQDDPIRSENAYAYTLALKNAKVPAELHVYPAGGHGYGLRPSANPVSTEWPRLAGEWMRGRGLLQRQ